MILTETLGIGCCGQKRVFGEDEPYSRKHNHWWKKGQQTWIKRIRPFFYMAHIIHNRWALESRFLLRLLASRNLVGPFNCHFFFFLPPPTDVMVGYLFHYNNEVTLALLGLSLSRLLHHSLNTRFNPTSFSPKNILGAYFYTSCFLHRSQQAAALHPSHGRLPVCWCSSDLHQEPAGEFTALHNEGLTSSHITVSKSTSTIWIFTVGHVMFGTKKHALS